MGNLHEICTVFRSNAALICGNTANNAVLFTWEALSKLLLNANVVNVLAVIGCRLLDRLFTLKSNFTDVCV